MSRLQPDGELSVFYGQEIDALIRDLRRLCKEAPGTNPLAAMMPGLNVLIDAELQQMQATAADTSVPQASRDALTKAIAADKQIENLVNQYWPPVVGDG